MPTLQSQRKRRSPVADGVIAPHSLDHMLVHNEQHLLGVLNQYREYFNSARPHQGSTNADPACLPRCHTEQRRFRWPPSSLDLNLTGYTMIIEPLRDPDERIGNIPNINAHY
jgi:hypothetical protein